MAMITHCDRCGGNVQVARPRTPHGELTLAGVFSLELTPVEARVCTSCGYTELYAVRPAEAPRSDMITDAPVIVYDE